jgi:hypothetical protein
MTRVIRKSRTTSSREASELLSGIFVAELVKPSKCIWIVSPWISDIPILDNVGGEFDGLCDIPHRSVRLSEVLVRLAVSGTEVVVGSTTDASNDAFLRRLEVAFDSQGLAAKLKVSLDAAGELHEKAITGDDFSVAGSMNITNNGVFVREEFIEFRTDEEFVARARMDSFDRFGGVL